MRIGRAIKFLSCSFATYYAGVTAHMNYHLIRSKQIDVPHPVWKNSEDSKKAFRKHQKLVVATENLLRGTLPASEVNKFFNSHLFYDSNFVTLKDEIVLKYFLNPMRRKYEIEPVMEYHTDCGFCLLLKFDPGNETWLAPFYDSCLVFVSMKDEKVSGMTLHINQKCFITGKFKRNKIMGPQHDFIRAFNSSVVNILFMLMPVPIK